MSARKNCWLVVGVLITRLLGRGNSANFDQRGFSLINLRKARSRVNFGTMAVLINLF